MSERRIVTPQEAHLMFDEWPDLMTSSEAWNLAHTVATEPDRIEAAVRTAVVKALRLAAGETNLAQSKEKVLHDVFNRSEVGRYLMDRADAIENGASL